MIISVDFIRQLKRQIIASRYVVAKIANAESLRLYFNIGRMLDKNFSEQGWGAKVLETISARLQQELPGLRGFSAVTMKKMRVFYQQWSDNDTIGSSMTTKLEKTDNEFWSSATTKLAEAKNQPQNIAAFFSIAFELKKGKFKPEYVGKMNFYLSALDDLIKQPHENPSIGIILCKEKNNKTVEYSFRDFNKPMGVAVFKTTDKLPKKYQNVLPSPEELKKLLD